MTITSGAPAGAEPDLDAVLHELRRAFPNMPWRRVNASAVASLGAMCVRVSRSTTQLQDCRPQTWTAEASHDLGAALPPVVAGTAAAATRGALRLLRREVAGWLDTVDAAMSGTRVRR